jgi:Flp pilus assembly protein TadB
MFGPTPIWTIVILIVVMADCASLAFGAAAGKRGTNQPGTKAAEQMSTKGASNSNAQWSADPTRGWVRADERHKMHEKADATKSNNVKSQGKGKKF